MKFLATYKSRLIFYMALLMCFLVGILLYSNKIMQDALLKEADNHLSRVVQLITARIESKQDELLHYTVMVRENITLQEYMFVVVRINSDVEPLSNFYQQSFGWLPVEYNMLLTQEGEFLAGSSSTNALNRVRQAIKKESGNTFAMKCDDGIEIVASSPISYLGEQIGTIVLSDDINYSSLSTLKRMSGGELFIVSDGNILNSTIKNINSQYFQLKNNNYYVNGQRFYVKKIPVPRLINDGTEMWLGITEEVLVKNLSSYKQTIFGLTIIGGLLILVVGIALVRDFSAPLKMMMSMTAEVVSGNKLPKMGKTKARNEIEGLANQFADMLQALREKEEEVKQAHEKLEKLAITDTLTNLYNRRHLDDMFPKLVAQAQRDHQYFNVVLFDLDHFKQINDIYGHPCGDQCLIHFSNLLRRCSRTNDYLFRTGGEEFLMLCNTIEKDGGYKLAEKIRETTQFTPFSYGSKTLHITVSSGINCINALEHPRIDMDAMLNQADKALYKAKEGGRNQVELACQCVESDDIKKNITLYKLKD